MKNIKFPFKKNQPNWKISEILKELRYFEIIYKKKPIKKNIHGMNFPHMFAFFFILKKIKPKVVIESGVFRGQSSWLIQQACPNAKIISIDIDYAIDIHASIQTMTHEYISHALRSLFQYIYIYIFYP